MNRIGRSIAVGLLLALCVGAIGCRQAPLLAEASMEPGTITPNADGRADRTRLSFRLRKDATVSIVLEDSTGATYSVRPPTLVAGRPEPYTLEFKGIVEGYTLPDEHLGFAVLTRMLADGAYTWRIRAQAASGAVSEMTGTLIIRDADTEIPSLTAIEIEPQTITPDQDGIEDVGAVRLHLAKDVETLSVNLVASDGALFPLYEAEGETPPHAAGPHTFVYDSLVYPNEAPSDGTYPIIIEAHDAVGQQVRAERSVTLADAGHLYGYIDRGEVEYSASTVALSETLCFTLTVLNAGETYIRTTGPWPGTIYQDTENFTTLDWPEDEGVFRIAMDREHSESVYPYRWGIGTPGVDLVQRNGYWYLAPGTSGRVTGCVEMTELPNENPLYVWMGLLHEQGKLPQVNHRVAPLLVTIAAP